MLSRRLFLYVTFSNICFFLTLLDYGTAFHTPLARLSALSNSSYFYALSINWVIANAIALWCILTLLVFGQLAAEERAAVEQQVLLQAVELGSMLFYGDQLLTHSSVLLTCVCMMGMMWTCVMPLRLQALATVESSASRLGHVFSLIVFLILWAASTLTLMSMTWQGILDQEKNKKDISSPIDSSDLYGLGFSVFIHLFLLLFAAFEFAFRLAAMEVSRALNTPLSRHASSYINHAFRLTESLLFTFLVVRLVRFHPHLPIFLMRQIIKYLSMLLKVPQDAWKYHLMTRQLSVAQPVTEEELRNSEDMVCTICYEPIETPVGTRKLRCGHVFHELCLRQWLEEHSTCPYCRADLLAPAPKPPPPQSQPAAPAMAANGLPGGAAVMEGEVEQAYLLYLQSARLMQRAVTASHPTDPSSLPPTAHPVDEPSLGPLSTHHAESDDMGGIPVIAGSAAVGNTTTTTSSSSTTTTEDPLTNTTTTTVITTSTTTTTTLESTTAPTDALAAAASPLSAPPLSTTVQTMRYLPLDLGSADEIVRLEAMQHAAEFPSLPTPSPVLSPRSSPAPAESASTVHNDSRAKATAAAERRQRQWEAAQRTYEAAILLAKQQLEAETRRIDEAASDDEEGSAA